MCPGAQESQGTNTVAWQSAQLAGHWGELGLPALQGQALRLGPGGAH